MLQVQVSREVHCQGHNGLKNGRHCGHSRYCMVTFCLFSPPTPIQLDIPLSEAFYKWMLGLEGTFTAQDLQVLHSLWVKPCNQEVHAHVGQLLIGDYLWSKFWKIKICVLSNNYWSLKYWTVVWLLISWATYFMLVMVCWTANRVRLPTYMYMYMYLSRNSALSISAIYNEILRRWRLNLSVFSSFFCSTWIQWWPDHLLSWRP